jgi:endogenous inhibitor of DNA gyrase (YacG/DUF329 family)
MKRLTCPHCHKPATLEHLRENPECAKAVQSLCALYRLAQRKTVTRAGGRPVTLVACPRCGGMVTKTQASRGHGCTPKPASASPSK